MKLRELFDNPNKPVEPQGASTTVGVCFGRFNPPHKGHRAAWEAAAEFDHFYVGTNQNTQGPNDPLPYDVKLVAMATVWPEVEGHVIPETNLFTLASKVYDQHGDNVDLKVCTDEAWLTDTLVKYNGVEGKHGYFKFNSIEQVPTPRLSSATALRAAVRSGDREAFSAAAGVPADTPIGKRSVQFFDLVKHYLDQFPEPVKKTKKAVAEGKAKSQNKIDKSTKRASKQLATTPNANLNGGDAYLNYRMNLALAGAPDYPTKAESEIGGDPLYSAYTDAEWEMLKIAARETGAGPLKSLNRKRSEEMPDVNTTSTIAKPKRNKYGV